MKRLVFILLVCVLGCKSTQVTSEQLPVVYMQKTACMGTCPVYDISIFPNGKVQLNAKEYLKIEGSYEAELSDKALTDLLTAFEQSNFSAFEKSYTSNMSDLPTTRLTYREGGETYKVVNYDGAPKSLKELEQRVHQLIDELDWTSSE